VSFFTGRDGSLYLNNQQVAKVRTWSIASNQAVLQPQSLGDTDAVVVPDVRNMSGSAEVLYYTDFEDTTSNVATLLQNCIKTAGASGTAVTTPSAEVMLSLTVKDGSARGRRISFGCYITSVGTAVAVGEVMQVSIAFQVNGAPMEVGL
jgi:hypothetical protein